MARRVLPAPPAPVSVTSRLSRSSALTSSICSARPTKLVSCAGRLWERAAFAVRRGGEFVADVWMAQLDKPLGPRQIPDRMRAELSQPGFVRNVVQHQIGGGPR